MWDREIQRERVIERYKREGVCGIERYRERGCEWDREIQRERVCVG